MFIYFVYNCVVYIQYRLRYVQPEPLPEMKYEQAFVSMNETICTGRFIKTAQKIHARFYPLLKVIYGTFDMIYHMSTMNSVKNTNICANI